MSRKMISNRLRFAHALALLIVLPGIAAAGQPEQDPFVVKPYVQLGDAPKLSAREQLVIMWHAADRDADWGVEFQEPGGSTWSSASSLTWKRVAVESIPAHRVFQAILTGLRPGKEIDYRVRHNDKVVF